MAARHKVDFTLDELIVVRETLVESRDRIADIIGSNAIRNEYTSRGKEGRAEWEALQKRYSLLETAIIAL